MPDVQVVVAGPGGDAKEGEREDEEDGVEGGEHLQEVSERRQHVELLPRQHLHGRMGQILKTVIGTSEVFPEARFVGVPGTRILCERPQFAGSHNLMYVQPHLDRDNVSEYSEDPEGGGEDALDEELDDPEHLPILPGGGGLIVIRHLEK